MRWAHTQVWPEERKREEMRPSAALERLASEKTMNGARPPSSRETFLSVGAHCVARSLPIAVEPVKERCEMRRWVDRSWPMA